MTTTKATKPQIRAACYTRISRDKSGERLGVQRQLDSCTALASQLGWEVHPEHIYSDDDLSAFNGKPRPGFEKMLTALRAGKVDALLCWHPDRLYRRLDDLVRLFEAAPGVEIRSVSGGTLDLSNASGKMLATILGGVASYESAHKIERQLVAARQKAERGKPQWKRAFGYLPDTRRKEDDDGKRKIDRKTAELVKDAYAALLAGNSLNEIACIFNDAGVYGLRGQKWTASTVSLFLRKPRNAGLRAHNGEIVGKGTWPPLVEESTWKAAQAVLNAPGRAPGRKSVRQHKLTGVLKCGKPGCDGYLAGNWVMQAHRGGPRAHAITYACKKCRGVSIRAEHVEPLIYSIVGGRLARPDAVDLLKAEIHDEVEAEKIRLELETLYGNLDRYADEHTDGLLTARQVKRCTDRDLEKIAKLEARQQDQERLRVFADIPLGTAQAVDAVKRLSDDRLRAVIDVLMVVTIQPVGRGSHVFDPRRVTEGVVWR